MQYTYYNSSITWASICCALRYIIRHVVWRPLVGGAHLFIGAHHAIMPVTQAACGIGTIIMAFLLHGVYNLLIGVSLIGTLKLLPLPTTIASSYIWCMRTQSHTTRMMYAVALACTGWICFGTYAPDAILYTAYWCIPIMAAAYAHRSPGVMMLGATFSAHIVGSCIWLFTTPMTSQQWLALIPIVAIERLTCASLMSLTHYAYTYIPYIITYYNEVRKQVYART